MGAGEDIPLPFTGAPVTLVVDETRMRAIVDLSEPDQLEFELLSSHTVLPRGGEVDGTLEFVSAAGPCRVRGSAATLPSHRVRFRPSAAPQLLLRSERVRAALGLVVDVELRGEFQVSTSRDLRGGGVLVAGPGNVEVGQTLRFRLHLPNRDDPVEGMARVARMTENGDFALHFLELTEDERASITLAVFEAQRGNR